MSHFHKTLQGRFFGEYLQFTQGIFDAYCQSKDMADFHNLQGKLETITLINIQKEIPLTYLIPYLWIIW